MAPRPLPRPLPHPWDQNGTPQQSSDLNRPAPSHTASSNPLASPPVVKAGEVMLIISLLLILLVVISVCIHFYIKREKRLRRNSLPKKDKDLESVSQPDELQSQEKKLAELVGTPLCEMGDSEPRHEMEDAEVLARPPMVDPDLPGNPQQNPVYIVSPATPDYDAGFLFGDMSTRAPAQPDASIYALYHAR